MLSHNESDDLHAAGMSASEGLRKYAKYLTPYEKEEIVHYTNIYYCGQECRDKINAPTHGPNYGFDTDDGEYIFRPKDHIAYRYEILEELGSGAFGQVLKAVDHINKEVVAVKLIRNQRKVLQQAVQEIEILQHVNTHDPKNLYGIVRMIESFAFRGHTCISYELLGTNLYEYLKEKDFFPMPLSLIRGIAARMLVALTFLGRENIIHCDLKPENILIRGSDPSVVKLVDLGSASFDTNNAFMYIQSRFYRAPEVILEQRYTKAIDWWSLGCILCELANGDPVFPGDDEKDQLGCIMEYLGPPPQSFIEASSARRKREFFDEHFEPRQRQTKKGRVRNPGSKSLAKFLGVSEDDDFLSFVMQFLQWDPAARVSPREAMRHKWIVNEFVFPTKSEERSTTASTPKAEAPGSAASPETNNDKAAATARSAPGKPAWKARAETTTDTAFTSNVLSNTQPTLESATRKMRSDAFPAGGQHSIGVDSAPPLTNPNGSNSPDAAALSSGGAPRRPSAAQCHHVQAFRRRQRRSTEMTDVEMFGGVAPGASTPIANADSGKKARDFLVAAEGGGATALTSGSVTSRELPHNGEAVHATSSLKLGGLSSTVLSLPTYPAVATTQRVAAKRRSLDRAAALEDKEPSHTVAAATEFRSLRSNTNTRPTTPSSAEKSSRVLELRRKFEAGGPASAATAANGKEHLEGSAKSGGNSNGPRFANMAGLHSGEKDMNSKSMSTSAKQRSVSEPEPATPPQAAIGKVPAASRRREYSLVIDGTPTPPPLECPPAAEQLHAHTKDYVMPSELGQSTIEGCYSLLGSGRPHEPGSLLVMSGRQQNHAAAQGDVCSSGETVMLSSPPNGSSGEMSSVGAGAAARSQAIVPRRVTQRTLPARRGASAGQAKGGDHDGVPGSVAEEPKGRHLPTNGVLRLMQTRQPLGQRQQQTASAALNEGSGLSSPTTVFPPLKRSSVR
jgi:dual specificity tyrosine-phosphorylation-regulated kinase 2/3/4